MFSYKENIEIPRTHTILMSEYTVGNFAEFEESFIVAAPSVSSCVVVILKNIDSTRTCSHFGMAYVNYANIHFPDVGCKNLLAFIDAFINVGGCLQTASIEILGGVIDDNNKVADKVKQCILQIGKIKGINSLNVNIPSEYNVSYKKEGDLATGEIISIAINSKDTYIRKAFMVNNKLNNVEFNNENAEKLLCNGNVKNIVKISTLKHENINTKIRSFYELINQKPCDLEKIKTNFCFLENSQIPEELYISFNRSMNI